MSGLLRIYEESKIPTERYDISDWTKSQNGEKLGLLLRGQKLVTFLFLVILVIIK